MGEGQEPKWPFLVFLQPRWPWKLPKVRIVLIIKNLIRQESNVLFQSDSLNNFPLKKVCACVTRVCKLASFSFTVATLKLRFAERQKNYVQLSMYWLLLKNNPRSPSFYKKWPSYLPWQKSACRWPEEISTEGCCQLCSVAFTVVIVII